MSSASNQKKSGKRTSPKNDQEKLEIVLSAITEVGFTLGEFLYRLFGEFTREELHLPKGADFNRRTRTHSQKVSNYLSKEPINRNHSVRNLISAIFNHRDSAPARHRATSSHAAPPDEDCTPMARHQLKAWAVDTTMEELGSEAEVLAKKTSELRLPANEQNWRAIIEFSLVALGNCIRQKAPMMHRIVLSIATSRSYSQRHSERAIDLLGESDRAAHSPSNVAISAILMLISSRNTRANYFQKVVGLWLFSCQAPAQLYQNLNRMGVSVSYNTTTNMLHQLSNSAAEETKKIAAQFSFLIIIDNINRLRKFWNPRLGQQDIMMSGAASTLMELQGTSPEAFVPKPLFDARKQKLRSQLTPAMLWSRIDHSHVSSVMALHCVQILAAHCPSLHEHMHYVSQELRTTFAIHRMPDDAVSKCHPLSSTSKEEGSAEGCAENLREILLKELGLPPEEVARTLLIIGGDLGTIEKLRALIALSGSCKHGFSSFSWVLPLVQLWHMGWADLARIISTHWGKPATKDPSSLWHQCSLLGRNVKPADRPDYYGAQALVFDVLEADVLDCWRLLLDVEDIEEYFSTHPTTGPELFEKARLLVSRWASTRSRHAVLQDPEHWDGPKSQDINHRNPDSSSESESDVPLARRATLQAGIAGDSPSRGDECLANSIQRMEESLIHREFAWAVADGDIGRVMQVMSVWQFTFMGANKSKYATELLELACGFMFEFPEALQNAIKNNWLCNLSGLKGCWMPMDLMQEHHIRELKDKAQRRDTDFEGTFFQHVISRNVRWFSATRASVNKALNENGKSRSSGHSQSSNATAVSRLRSSLETERVHSFVSGQSHGWLSRDNLTEGRRLMPTKLHHFLRRTTTHIALSDPENIEGLEDDAEQDGLQVGSENQLDGTQDDAPELPAPGMIIGGRYIPGDVETPEFEEFDAENMPPELRHL